MQTPTISSLSQTKKTNGKATPTSKLHTLWQRIEKHTKRNASYQKKLEQNYQLFESIVLEHEEAQSHWLGEQIKHLSKFISRKTLSDYEREELLDWISSDLDYLYDHPFCQEAIVNELNLLVTQNVQAQHRVQAQSITQEQIDEARLDLDESFDGYLDLSDDQIREVMVNPQKLIDHVEKIKREYIENMALDTDHDENRLDDQEDAFEDDFFDEFYQDFQQSHFQDQAKQKKLDKLFKGSQLNKMYKRIAAKIHPDKEQDPRKKQIKHSLMQALAEARMNKDGFTVLQMYLQHFDDDPTFDAETLASLEPLLEEKISSLNAEYREIQHSNELPALVWRKFKAPSKKKRIKQMEEHAFELQMEIKSIQALIKECSSVKALKMELKQRQRPIAFNPFMLDGMPIF